MLAVSSPVKRKGGLMIIYGLLFFFFNLKSFYISEIRLNVWYNITYWILGLNLCDNITYMILHHTFSLIPLM